MKKTLKKSLLRLLGVTLLLSSCLFACDEKNEQLLPIKETSLQNVLSKDRVNVESPKYIEDESISGEYELREGTLHFKNAETYFKIWQKFSKMKPEERVEASKAMGLKSLLEIQHEFVVKTEKVKTKEELYALLKEYSDIIVVNDSITSFINTDAISAALTNRKGIVYLGKSLRRYKGDEITNIENGDENLLNTSKSSNLVKTYKYINKVEATQKNGRPAYTCLSFTATKSNGDFIQYPGYCHCGGGDREIFLEISMLEDDLGSGNYMITPYSRGTPLKKVFGSWYIYSTNNSLGSNWSCTAVGNSGTQTKVSIANYSYSNNYSVIDYTGDPMYFLFYPKPFSHIGFDFNYNGTTYYYSQGVGSPGITATCI